MDQTIREFAERLQAGKRVRTLNTTHIVFLVIAAAAPLTAMVGNLPIAIGRGNGAGLPGAFLVATATLVCFAFGYAEMSRRIVNTGAFYTYVVLGLGRSLGVGAAFIAAFSYAALTVGLAAAFGFFVSLVLHDLGTEVPWGLCALVGITLVGLMGYRSIDLSSRILGVLLVAEIGVLIWFDASVVLARGVDALPLAAFEPARVLGPGFAIGLMFAYTSFIGFEAAALFGEESQNPTQSIPRATLISVAAIGVFYLATAWLVIGAAGPEEARATATEKGGEFLFVLIGRFAGETAAELGGLLLCTSLLAAYLAIHNAATRYLFALGREKILPPFLGQFNARRYAPSAASATITLATLVSIGLFFVSGKDPYLTIMPTLVGLATLGVIALQALAAIAIVAYFRRQQAPKLWSATLAPSIGAVGLAAAVVLVVRQFPVLTGVDDAVLNYSPTIYPALAVAGVGFAAWLRHYRPVIYEGIGRIDLRAQPSRRTLPLARYSLRHCIIGAGPGGLLAARALKLAGIPYDHFERHSDVGGIWDIDSPGTPMYESAHFISSKFTSAFFGFPMPADYPDYPSYQQILAYIRSFANAFGLTESIRFNTSVVHAEPLGAGAEEGWRVRLSSGEERTYAGLICATGVTWHPNLPDYPGLSAFQGEARHTVTHRAAAELDGRRVLIVGCGNSGADIACDAARHASRAWLSVRRGYRFVPKHIFGVPTDVFVGGGLAPPKGVVVPVDTSRLLDAVVGDLTRFGLPAPDHEALQSHPIMNTQVLHHLAHGDLKAKCDVHHFTPKGAVFTDGTTEEFDLVLFATGYQYRLPYLDESHFEWVAGHPKLYLNIFHRRLRGLAVLGFVEFADAGYQRFDEMAQMVAMDAHLMEAGTGLAAWQHMKANDTPNLRGTMTYIDSPRHANYVDAPTYRRVLSEIRARFGWFDPTDSTYDSLRVDGRSREDALAGAATRPREALAGQA
jgi:amino acid transporter